MASKCVVCQADTQGRATYNGCCTKECARTWYLADEITKAINFLGFEYVQGIAQAVWNK